MSITENSFYRFFSAALAAVFLFVPLLAIAGTNYKLSSPPSGERWFAILINNEQVGFYRQEISELQEGGYTIKANGSVRMRVMGFTKESYSHEVYNITSALALKSFEVEQTINGNSSHLTGRLVPGGLQVKRTAEGKTVVRLFKAKNPLIPPPMLNLLPLFRDPGKAKLHRVLTFDPEDMAIKEVKIIVIGEETTPDGKQTALRLRNNLYPFVDNDIWIDADGNTLLESVRDGLVITRAESSENLAAFISGMALSKKDLIYDFSIVRIDSPLKQLPAKLKGLSVSIDGYGEQIPLLSNGCQQVERKPGNITINTGSLAKIKEPVLQTETENYIKPSDGIESGSPDIIAKARSLAEPFKTGTDKVKAITDWTSKWIEDQIEDAGSALAGMNKRTGNCQTHAKLYTAIARAAGIPTRFVSGLVSQDGTSFLYHSWAESLIDGHWIAVDPTFNQVPADPTHIAFFEGNRISDLAPIVGVIGKIKLKILDQE